MRSHRSAGAPAPLEALLTLGGAVHFATQNGCTALVCATFVCAAMACTAPPTLDAGPCTTCPLFDAGEVDGGHVALADGGAAADAGAAPSDGGPFLFDGGVLLPAIDSVGGTLTRSDYGPAPFLTQADGLPAAAASQFSIGRELFNAPWVAAPSSNRAAIDGLGPLFHAASCVACHPAPGRPPTLVGEAEGGMVMFGLLLRLARPIDDGWGPDPGLGGQLQPSGTAGEGEAAITWKPAAPPDDSAYSDVASRSPAPVWEWVLASGSPSPHDATAAGGRLSPHLIGLGLLERVPVTLLAQMSDADDLDDDGISGRVHWRATPNGLKAGRFGHKALAADLIDQSAAAFANDMGLTSPGVDDDCTALQTDCLAAPHGGDPEVSGDSLEAVGAFLRYLAVPAARRDNGDPEVQRGAVLFDTVGCAACHVATLTTGNDEDPVLAQQTFHPYTDLLLHDMGPGLADAIGEGDAAPEEWRTAPLWGLGLVEAQGPLSRFLHDGRARSLEDAILWHGGEARASRDTFESLVESDREALLLFLRSL